MEYEHFFKGLSLYLEEKIWIGIRIRARSRIRIRIRVMLIYNTLLRETRYALCHVFRGEEEPKTFIFLFSITRQKKFVKLSAHILKVLI